MPLQIISKFGPVLYTDEHSIPFVLSEAYVADEEGRTSYVQVLRSLAAGWDFQFREGIDSLLQPHGDPKDHPTLYRYDSLEDALASAFFQVFQKLLPGVVKAHLQFLRHEDMCDRTPCRWIYGAVTNEKSELEDIHAECLCPHAAGKGKKLFLQMYVREDGQVVYSTSKQSRAFDLVVEQEFDEEFPGMERVPTLAESSDFEELDVSASARMELATQALLFAMEAEPVIHRKKAIWEKRKQK